MSIRWRLTLFNALAIGTILVLLGVFLYTALSAILPSGVEKTVQGRALEAARTIGAGKKLSPKQVERLTLNGVYVIVRDGRGRVLARTVNLVPRNNGRDDTAWRRALDSGGPAGGEANLSPEPPDYIYAVPVKPPGSGARVVEAGKSYESAREALNVFGVSLAVGLLVALLLAVVGAYFLARAALSPVDAVVASARQITEGDLSRRLPVANRRDEIGRLTRTINSLLSRLESAFARREETLARQRSFTADASHELRTPLTSISGYAGMLDEWALEDPEASRRAVAAIQRESERMKVLVEELLVLARGDEGAPLKLGRQSLDVLAGEAVRRARDATGGKVSVGYEPAEKLVEATFDRDRIRQVADIFLDNAAKYTPQGGEVRVAVREEDGWALLEVSDTGVGIPEGQLPLIFERFYRADSARAAGGAGLGLPIARQIAEAHGGTVEAKSEPGKGSTFTLKIRKDGAVGWSDDSRKRPRFLPPS